MATRTCSMLSPCIEPEQSSKIFNSKGLFGLLCVLGLLALMGLIGELRGLSELGASGTSDVWICLE